MARGTGRPPAPQVISDAAGRGSPAPVGPLAVGWPSDRALVPWVGDKGRIQALRCNLPIRPMLLGTPERRARDFRHAGTTALSAAIDYVRRPLRRMQSPPPHTLGPRLPQGRRPQRPRRDGHLQRRGQLCSPQHVGGQGPAGSAAAPACPLHADACHLIQSGRNRDPRLHRQAQPRPQTLQVGQIRRRHTRGRQAPLPTCQTRPLQ